MAFENFPYTDFHNLNLDWFLKTTKDLNDKWDKYYKEWNEWQKNVQNFIDNLDFHQEIVDYMDALKDSGELSDIIDTWLTEYGVITIGDSYGEGYTPDGMVTPWCDILKNNYFKDASFFVNKSKGGSGFGANTHFSELLQNAIDTLTDDQKERVRYVIIAGGWNDQFIAGSTVTAGMREAVAKMTQLPNATLYVGWIATPRIGYSLTTEIDRYNNIKTLYCTNWFKYKFLTGADMALRWISVLSSDNIHPNATGQWSIADSIYKSIQNAYDEKRSAEFALDGVDCVLNTYKLPALVTNNVVHATISHISSFLDLAFTTPISLTKTAVKVMTHSLSFVNESAVCTCPCVIHEKTKGKYTSTTCQLTFNPFDGQGRDVGKIYFQICDATINGYVTYEDVDEIQIYGVQWDITLY